MTFRDLPPQHAKADDSTSEIEISDDDGGSDVPKPKSKNSKAVTKKAETPKVSAFRVRACP